MSVALVRRNCRGDQTWAVGGRPRHWLAQTAAPAPASGQLDLLDALESVKQLVGLFGADKGKRMVHLLGG
jgi:hypothetical protein